jgi:hypothetical protein
VKNVTISLDEDLARWVRVRAAEQDKSVSRYVADLLEEQRARRDEYARASERFLGRSPRTLRGTDDARYPTRDEVHER